MSKHHLLLVDSDAKSLRVTEVSLKNAGFSVATAVNGADALDKISLSAPDLVISETRMPEMDGFELVKRLKQDKRFGAIPFVFLSNDKSVTDKVRGLELGVDDYLQRPMYIKEIVTRINLLLQRRENEQLDRKDPKASGFSGNLSEMGLVDLLQTFEVGRKSGQVRIQLGDRSANLWFRDGKIVDVEVGALAGEAAFYRLLTYNDGLFFIEFHPIDRPDRIPLSSQALLLEGMRRLEERNRILDQLPPPTTVFDVDYKLLPEKLPTLPDEVNGLLRLFDGRRTLQHVIDESTFDDVPALSIIKRLYQQGLLLDVSQHPPKPAGEAQSAEEVARWARRTTPPPSAPQAAASAPSPAAREPEPAWFEPPSEGLSTVNVEPGARGSATAPAHPAGQRAGHRIEEHSSFEGFDGPTPPSARRVPMPPSEQSPSPYRQPLPSNPQTAAAASESIATVVRFPSRRGPEAENPPPARAGLPTFPTEPPPEPPPPPPVIYPPAQREPGRSPSGALQLRNGMEARTDSGFHQAASQSIPMPPTQPRSAGPTGSMQFEESREEPVEAPPAGRARSISSSRVAPRVPVSAEEAADLSAIRKRRRPPYVLATVLVLIAVVVAYYWFVPPPPTPPPSQAKAPVAVQPASPVAPLPAAQPPAAPSGPANTAQPAALAPTQAVAPSPTPAPAVAAAPPAAPPSTPPSGPESAAPAGEAAAAPPPAAGQPEPSAPQAPVAPGEAQAGAPAVPSDKAYDDALQKGQELYKEGSVRAAADEFKKAAAAKPDADTPLVAMGSTLFELNETDQALVFIKKALAINPNNSRAYLTLGTIYQTMNKRADAAAAYRKYLQLAPDGEFAKDVKHILPVLARSRR